VTTGRKAVYITRWQQTNPKLLIVLSLTALRAVLSGYTQPPQPDEGAAAHIFIATDKLRELDVVRPFSNVTWGRRETGRDVYLVQLYITSKRWYGTIVSYVVSLRRPKGWFVLT
jgi:hypothetical protein